MGPTLSEADEGASELERVRAALAQLRRISGVAQDRMAILGHGYDATYAVALRDVDGRLVIAATPGSS